MLEDERRIRALFRSLGQVTGMVPEAYDLNRRGQWRPYHEAALVVDSLTQRTQLVELRGQTAKGGAARVVLATGKHGEPPQLVASWDGEEATPRVDRELLLALPLDLFTLQRGQGEPIVVVAGVVRGEGLAKVLAPAWEEGSLRGWEWSESSVELPAGWWEAVFRQG